MADILKAISQFMLFINYNKIRHISIQTIQKLFTIWLDRHADRHLMLIPHYGNNANQTTPTNDKSVRGQKTLLFYKPSAKLAYYKLKIAV